VRFLALPAAGALKHLSAPLPLLLLLLAAAQWCK
jgi:hypothetical protein